jgi:hypothetical protein
MARPWPGNGLKSHTKENARHLETAYTWLSGNSLIVTACHTIVRLSTGARQTAEKTRKSKHIS